MVIIIKKKKQTVFFLGFFSPNESLARARARAIIEIKNSRLCTSRYEEGKKNKKKFYMKIIIIINRLFMVIVYNEVRTTLCSTY